MKTQLTVITTALILLTGLCSAQTSTQTSTQTRHWSNVADHVSADMETFEQLFQNAYTTGFGITILGDSQETPARAHGRYYIPALGDQFYQYYGNVPKTGIVTELSQSHAWLSAGDSVGELTSDSIFSLPSVNIKRYDSMPFENGLLAQAALNGYTTDLAVPRGGYFNGNPLKAELIIRTRPNSGEAFWKATLTDQDRRSYIGGELIGSGLTDVDADRRSVEFVSADLGTFDVGPQGTMQIIARSGERNRTVDIAGVRFVNSVDPSGVAIQSLSQGLYSASQFLRDRNTAASLFKVLAGEDVIAIQYGTNDARAGRTASEFKRDLNMIIATVRRWSGNSSLPIIIISDPDFSKTLPQYKLEFDMYPGVAAELATELDHVLALNTRSIANRNNYYVGSSDFNRYSDGLHATKIGSERLARWQVDSLMTLTQQMSIKGTSRNDLVTFNPVANKVSVNGIVEPIPSGITSVRFFGEGGVDRVTSIGDPNQEELAVLQESEMAVHGEDYFFGAYDVAEVVFNSDSGPDTAVIYDSPAEESFFSSPNFVQLRGNRTIRQASNVGEVYVFSSGGDDSARMRGDSESETVQGNLERKRIRMTGDEFSISISGFETVNVNGGVGESDIARIVDSIESEIVYFRSDYGRFTNNDIDYSIRSFETVNFLSTSGNDIGIFQRTPGSNVSGNGTWGSLSGRGYNNNSFGLGSLRVR